MEDYGKIIVLAGGPSNEHDISIKSGKAVYNALKGRAKSLDFLDVKEDFRESLKAKDPDLVFIALHGTFGEDGTVQAMLEEMHIPYTGSGVEASRLAMDKIASKNIFKNAGILVPKFDVIKKGKDHEAIPEGFKVPFVIKPRNEGSSIGLSVVRDSSQINNALKKAFEYSDMILIEEYIHGRELTVGILENRALPVIEIMAKNQIYDYEAKYKDEDTLYLVPADIEKEKRLIAQAYAVKAHNALNCADFSRVDMRMDKNGNIFTLEVNTIPGLTERSLLPKAARAAGINFENLCMKLIELAYKKRRAHGQKQFK